MNNNQCNEVQYQGDQQMVVELTAPVSTVMVRLLLLFKTFTACRTSADTHQCISNTRRHTPMHQLHTQTHTNTSVTSFRLITSITSITSGAAVTLIDAITLITSINLDLHLVL